MIYEITDTSRTMHDTFGNDLKFHPVYVVEGDTEDEALQAWCEQYGRDSSGTIVKPVTT